jgi:CRISPR-associated protein Csx16
MTTHLVTRHPGAVQWIKSQGLHIDCVVPHLDISVINRDDIVVGILPIHLAAQVCSLGAKLLNLSVDIPLAFRGQELTCKQLSELGAKLETYTVTRQHQ